MQLKPIEQSFAVNFKYSLHFTNDVFESNNSLFAEVIKSYTPNEKVKLLFVVDDGVLKKHPELIGSIKNYCLLHSSQLLFTECLVIPGGEIAKNNYDNVDRIISAINNNAICRHSFVIVIGGGAVIDVAGYAASVAHRGVKLIRIPTTVLSQNDAAIGVKNGINAYSKKNFIGTFAPPYAILNDRNFLTSLGQRDWIAGVAEAIKVALIKDEFFFNTIKENAIKLKERDMDAMLKTIYRCAEMHMEHIAKGGDPFESGSSRPLDFGHWSAHKLEQMSNYSLRHGEAVAKGIALDLTYSQLVGFISVEILDEILEVMADIGFDLSIPVSGGTEMQELLKGIQEFREHLGGELTITLINGIGQKIDVHEIDMELMKNAVNSLNNKYKINVA
ncbi:3-dehydroquinate synthase [uncultured Eudoraea sp.]|uniref:3-dehydroquinate synthase n=1 Tax=uncultured Eudoraea sp. TaxID=1035614 RepID=UPI0026312835|nr:3-dehydroquinate synthase [uncultured Eudoraea sp.]